MSGPKCGMYELSEERKRQERKRLEEELRQKALRKEQERIRKEQERIQKEQERTQEIEKENAAYEAMFEELFAQREMELVAQAVDEAMEEMGYELVASMTPKVETDSFMQAQVFSFSDGTGVQVIEANGSISMEVVGLGTTDRCPTSEEQEYLAGQMEAFCDAYRVLDEKLEKRGICKSAVISHQPPDAKFARVLNLSSFEQHSQPKTLQRCMRGRRRTEETMSDNSSGRSAHLLCRPYERVKQ